MKFKWIHEHRQHWPVKTMCQTLHASRGGYYDWIDRPLCARGKRRVELIEQIRVEQERSRGLYGSPRIHAALAARQIEVCVNTVATLMKQAQIRSKRSKQFRAQTTDSRHDYQPAPNLLDQQFTAALPDQKWLCDITYVPTDEGPIYLASVLDVCSRKIVGWQIADHLRTELCLDALSMAIQTRRPKAELIHHSDRGVQYACDAYQQALKQQRITVSMSRRGNCYDNAMMESFHSSYKTELVHQQPGGRFATKAQARQMTFEYIEAFYNRQRRHSAIGYLSPEQFEASLN